MPVFLAVLAATAVFLTSSFSHAETVDLPPVTGNLAEKIRETKEGINEAEFERRRVLGSLYAINLRMKKISTDKGKLTDELMQSQDAVETVVAAIHALETQIRKQRLSLKNRLRALYKISGESYIGAVFSTKNAFEFDSTLRNLKIVSDHDFQLIQSYRENLHARAQQRKKLKSQVERLLLVEKRIKKQEVLLAGEHEAKTKLAAMIEKDTRQRMSEIKHLRQTQTVADVEIERLLRPSIYEKKGSLAAPVAVGSIAKDFGLRVDDRFKFKMSHKGWQIKVPVPAPVLACDEGVIVFSGNLEGYGSTVIIDHGDHYYSIYAGVSAASIIKMAPGKSVVRNEAIAQTESDLYFEIRHFSEPENPASWISAKSSLLTQKHRPLDTAFEKQQAKADFD